MEQLGQWKGKTTLNPSKMWPLLNELMRELIEVVA